MKQENTPKAFILRRLHSLAGLGLVLYLIEHLFVNSQAALFFGDDGKGFIEAVNSIHSLPYLPVIEIAVLALPILIHTIWGIKYAFTAEPNSFGNSGTTPYLPQYSRNRAYTWQRITSYLLVIGIIAHVVHMRFLEYPTSGKKVDEPYYMVKVSDDPGLYTLAERIRFKLYNDKQILALEDSKEELHARDPILIQKELKTREFTNKLKGHVLKDGEVVAVADNFGTAELLMVRNVFKNPWMIGFYTLFVLAAGFHAFNGLWTFLIKWGITLTVASQKMMLKVCSLLMFLITFLGLVAIWGTYWINLRQ